MLSDSHLYLYLYLYLHSRFSLETNSIIISENIVCIYTQNIDSNLLVELYPYVILFP